MNVTLRQLRLFLALADSGSVSAAARALHVTQPTASMQLKHITDSVGVPLYDVISKKIYLTDLGRDLAETARTMAQSWEVFEQKVSGSKGMTRGKMRIAVVSTAKYFMPRLVGSFCKRFPEIDISLEILNRDGVLQRLRQNMDDLYIMSKPPTDVQLNDEVFMSNPLVVIAATSDPLAKLAAVPIEQLRERRFILREKGSGTRMASDQHFRQHKFRPDVRLELGSNEAIKEAVAGGLGVGLVSRHALHGLAREHGVAVVDVSGFPISSNWHVVHAASKQLPPVAAAFKAHIMSEVARRKRR